MWKFPPLFFPVAQAGLCALALLAGAGPSLAAPDDAAWVPETYSKARLVSGAVDDGGEAKRIAGIEIRLDPGWKTYWRTPGDSGVPPQFDWSKSENIDSVTVLWPAPRKFDDGAGGHSLGYHDQFVLPLRIVAKSADKPVTLRADIDYAVCEKL